MIERSTRDTTRLESGRWVRREGRIEILLDRPRVETRAGVAETGEIGFSTPAFTSRDVIDPRIDPCAQFALLRLRDAGGDALAAVKSGGLAGIFGANLLASVKLAQKLGTVWWELLPPGEDAALVMDPGNPLAPPTMIFRASQTAGPQQKCLDKNRLDPALRKAWATHLLGRRGELAPCNLLRVSSDVRSELAGASLVRPVSNLIPPLLCQLRRPPIARRPTADPILVKSSTAVFLGLSAGATVDGFFCPCIRQAGFSWSIECSVLFPKGTEGGIWRVGFVQNMLSDEFEAIYEGAAPKRYRVTGPLADFNEEEARRLLLLSTVPYMITTKIRGKDGKVLPFSNPVFIMPLSGTPSTETFQLAYADAPSFAIEPRLGGDPKSPLVSVKRTVRFRTFLVSTLTEFPPGARPVVVRSVVHAASEPFEVKTSVRFSPRGSSQVLFNLAGPQPPAPPPKLIARSPLVPKLSGETANAVSRARYAALGIATHPACPGACA